MGKNLRIILFFVLPILATIIYPPQSLVDSLAAVVAALLFFGLMGYWMWTRRSLALTFSIFVQGINVIIRLMMFFSNSVDTGGTPNLLFALTSVIGLAISVWLMIRLDGQDVHTFMTR
jgi:hypothetical protein